MCYRSHDVCERERVCVCESAGRMCVCLCVSVCLLERIRLVALALLTCEEENLKKISLSFPKSSSCKNFIQILRTAFARIYSCATKLQ